MTRALQSVRKSYFNGLHLSKVYIFWAKKVQKSYLSWHWRVMQNLERNQLVVWKLTKGIWRILIRALKSLNNLHFNGLFDSTKNWGKVSSKLTCAFKNDMRNLENFHRLKNSDFILESKMAELNENQNSKQPDQPDAVWKLYFTLEINE